MNFRKVLTLLVCAVMACTVMAACQSSAPATSTAPAASTSTAAASTADAAPAEPAKKEFSLYAEGSDNVRIQFEKQVDTFNNSAEWNPDGYVCKLQFIVSGTGTQAMVDRMTAAHKAGQKNTDFDVFEFGGDNIPNYISRGGEDMFLDLDFSKIPNEKNLDFRAAFYEEKFLPYRGTTVVLAYNADKVTNPPKTDAEMYQWIKDNPGRFAYNPPDSGGAGGAFVRTALYNFLPEEAMISIDEKWVAEWDQGFDLLAEIHPFLYKSGGKVVYPNKNQGTIDALAAGEIDMTPAWADMIISQTREGTLPASTTISQISPAFTGSTVVFGIPSMGSNPDAAHAWINYMISPEAQNIALDMMAAIPVIDFSLLDPELTSIISSLNLEEFRLSAIGPLGTTSNEMWTERIGILS